jgi:hypothetical protein
MMIFFFIDFVHNRETEKATTVDLSNERSGLEEAGLIQQLISRYGKGSASAKIFHSIFLKNDSPNVRNAQPGFSSST